MSHDTNRDPNPDIGAQFLQDIFDTHVLNNQDAYSWVPLEMRQQGFLQGFRFSKRYSTRCSRGETVGEYKILNSYEDRLVNSLGGILSNALGVWNKRRSRFPTNSNPNPRTKPGALYENLEAYYCKVDGCSCRLVMYRVNGGLVFFENVDSDGDVILHNERCMCITVSFEL